MNFFIRKRQVYVYLGLLFLVLLLYSVQDLQTSRNMGFDGSLSRRGVYISLFSLIMLLGIFFLRPLTHGFLFQRKAYLSPVKKSLLIIGLWVLFVNLVQRTDIWVSAIHLGLCALWFLTYTFFSGYLSKHPDSFRHVQKIILFMFLFYAFSALFASYVLRDKFGRIVVVNLAYYVLVFLPWIFMMGSKIKRLGLILVLIVLIFSMKRGALLVFPFMVGVYLKIEAKIKRDSMNHLMKLFLILSLFIGGLFIADRISGGFLGTRFSSEELASGSGRTVMYLAAIENIKNRTFLNFLVGKGSGSSIEFLGTGVHNEWLEFLFSFGLIGAFLYLLFFLSLFKELRCYIRNFSSFAPGYAAGITYMLLVGMYGGIFFVHSTLYVMAFFGAADGLSKKNTVVYRRKTTKGRI